MLSLNGTARLHDKRLALVESGLVQGLSRLLRRLVLDEQGAARLMGQCPDPAKLFEVQRGHILVVDKVLGQPLTTAIDEEAGISVSGIEDCS